MADRFVGANETLHRVLDDMAIDGKIAPNAIDTFIKAHRGEIVVDKVTNSCTLHDKPLRQGVEDILAKEEFWRPKGGEEDVQREKVEGEVIGEQLKRAALSGNVTQHGRLRNHMGGEAYDAWCAETGAKPGVHINASEVNGEKVHSIKRPSSSNPWSKAGWNFTEQSRLVKTLGIERATEIAAAAGCVPGKITKFNPDYN